jgi:dihydrofolate reductase
MITLIAAIGKNNSLGLDNKLLWHLPNDFKRFKELTSGNNILMGRKTFESLPGVLPNRTHIIITKQENYQAPSGCLVFDNLLDTLKSLDTSESTIYVIGGGEIYKQTIDTADRLELTVVDCSPEADTFFPDIDDTWKLVKEEKHEKDERHKYSFSYLTYEKKSF